MPTARVLHRLSTHTGTTGTDVLSLGSRNGTGFFSQVDLAEVLVYGQSLADADRLRIEGYLNERYGVF